MKTPTTPVGKRVLLTGDHPYTGHTGVVEKWESTIAGLCFVVELDNGLKTAVFAAKHMHVLAGEGK